MSLRRTLWFIAPAVLGLGVSTARADDDSAGWANPDATALAYTHPLPAAEPTLDREAFMRGRTQFRRAWLDGSPQQVNDGRGLGPLYNRMSCIACHPANGRGRAPAGPDERMQSMLVRLSIAGRDRDGGPRPHPSYGGQFNEEGVPPVRGEGRVAVQWQPVRHRRADGSVTLLRRPVLRFSELAYGPLDGVRTSPRVGPAVFGLGLLESVPPAALLAWLRRASGDGVHGRLNQVWDPIAAKATIGRFGWKANTATLQGQIVGAAHGDLGLTSTIVPQPPCAERQRECLQQSQTHPGVELDDTAVHDMTLYLANLAPAAPRQVDVPAVQQGRALFAQVGCARCHAPALPLGPTAPAGLAGRTIAPYTDLALHDMGPGLSDHRPDYQATGRQWRTPPLWGIGLVPTVNEHTEFLHDGRARSLDEAIAWHDGEARRVRQRYERLPAAQRDALLQFLASL